MTAMEVCPLLGEAQNVKGLINNSPETTQSAIAKDITRPLTESARRFIEKHICTANIQTVLTKSKSGTRELSNERVHAASTVLF